PPARPPAQRAPLRPRLGRQRLGRRPRTGRGGVRGGAAPADRGDRQDGDMAQVTVTAQRVIHGSVEQVRTALADYQNPRPRILTEHYSEYELKAGGQGAGSLVHWKPAATEK